MNRLTVGGPWRNGAKRKHHCFTSLAASSFPDISAGACSQASLIQLGFFVCGYYKKEQSDLIHFLHVENLSIYISKYSISAEYFFDSPAKFFDSFFKGATSWMARLKN